MGLFVGRGGTVGDVCAVFGGEEPFDGWRGGGKPDEGDLLGEGVTAQGGNDGRYSWTKGQLGIVVCGVLPQL